MNKIFFTLALLILTLILSACANQEKKSTSNNLGKILEKTNEYIIWTRFQYDLNLLKVEIPKEVTDHCTALKKNTYRLVHDESKTWVILFEPLTSWPDVYRYICAENETIAKDIRKKLLLTDSYFNQQSLKWYEESFRKKYPYGQFFNDNNIFLSFETEEYKSEQNKKKLVEYELYKKKVEEEQRQTKLKYLEEKYSKNCLKYKNNNINYEKCLNEQEQIAKKNKEKEEAKLEEENKKKQLIAEKQKIEQQKIEAKMANMKPEERRAYICENTYGFRKGSDKFSDCVYKIMNAEVELQKLELQKKLAEAQQETARANESAARANASRSSTPSYDPNVAAAMERTNEIERAKILLNLGQALRTPAQSSAPTPQRNCRVNPVNGYINCW